MTPWIRELDCNAFKEISIAAVSDWPLFTREILRLVGRQALAHVRRERKRGHVAATREAYMIAIHNAVLKSRGVDDYTGAPLDWEAIGT